MEGLSPYSYVIAGEWLYFCNQYMPALFRYHIEKHNCEYVTGFDRNFVNTNFVNINFIRMYAYKNEIWMLPFLDGKIVCYNTDTEQAAYYDIPNEVEEKQNPFIAMFFWKQRAYVTPYRRNRYILIVDLQTHDITKMELINKGCQEEKLDFGYALQYGDKIYLTENSKNRLLSFCLEDHKVSMIAAGNYLIEGAVLKLSDNKIWFFPVIFDQERELVIYDILERRFSGREYPIKKLSQGEICVTAVSGQKFWILANKKRKIYRIGKNLEIEAEIRIVNCDPDHAMIYCSVSEFADRFYWGGYLEDTPLIEVKDGKVRLVNFWEKKNVLEVYFDMLKKSDVCMDKREESNIGKRIYDNMLSSEIDGKKGGLK